eukprot:8640384-Pyramimonas_sp.AAC.1
MDSYCNPLQEGLLFKPSATRVHIDTLQGRIPCEVLYIRIPIESNTKDVTKWHWFGIGLGSPWRWFGIALALLWHCVDIALSPMPPFA